MFKMLALCACLFAAAEEFDCDNVPPIPEQAVEKGAGGKPSGVYQSRKAYYVDGQKIAERAFYEGVVVDDKRFADDKLHGCWRTFHQSGKLFAARPYVHGKLHGTVRNSPSRSKTTARTSTETADGHRAWFAHEPFARPAYCHVADAAR